MDPTSDEYLARFKARYPQMDLELVQFFAPTMSAIYDTAILMESHFTKLGLSKGRFMVMIQLLGIDDPDGVSISDVLSQYRVRSATMTGIIDTLEKEGLIERVKSPEDRRRVNIRITDTGRAFMDDFLPKHHAYMKAFSSKLSERERQTLRRLIGKLHQSIAEGVGQDIQPPPRSTS